MNLAILEKYDRRTATDIVAAAALASAHNIKGQEPSLVRQYDSEVRELLSQIREQLRISDGDDPEAQFSISNYLTKEVQRNLFADAHAKQRALADAGQDGRLDPALYIVEQPKAFIDMFSVLSIKRSHVDQAVKHPDDYQHIMDANANNENKGKVSIFLKRITEAKSGNDHWLLVQTHRNGLTQIVQSAWRVFPEVVDLSRAEKPIDVLRSFVEVFGLEVNVAGITGKFIESIPAKKGEQVQLGFQASSTFFHSFSSTETDDPNVVQVGAAYCIDTAKYAELLEQKKLISSQSLVRIKGGGPLAFTGTRT